MVEFFRNNKVVKRKNKMRLPIIVKYFILSLLHKAKNSTSSSNVTLKLHDNSYLFYFDPDLKVYSNVTYQTNWIAQ